MLLENKESDKVHQKKKVKGRRTQSEQEDQEGKVKEKKNRFVVKESKRKWGLP